MLSDDPSTPDISSTPSSEFGANKREKILNSFEAFIDRYRAPFTGATSEHMLQNYRITDLLKWYAEDLYEKSQQGRASTTTETPRSIQDFMQMLEDTIGLSIPVSVTLPPSEVVHLLIERKAERDLKNVSQRLMGIQDENFDQRSRPAAPSFAFGTEELNDSTDSCTAVNMTEYLADIGSKLVSSYADPISTVVEEMADGVSIPEKKLKEYRCPENYCKFTTTSLFHLSDHQRRPHRKNRWNCAICQKFSTNRIGNLEVHYAKTHGSTSSLIRDKRSLTNTCMWCDRCFANKSRHESHLRRGCPMAPSDDDGKLNLNRPDSDDILNTELWPKCQRLRPFWLTRPQRELRSSLDIDKAKEFKAFTAKQRAFKATNVITFAPIVSKIKPIVLKEVPPAPFNSKRLLTPSPLLSPPQSRVGIDQKPPIAKTTSASVAPLLDPSTTICTSRTPFSLKHAPRKDEIRNLIAAGIMKKRLLPAQPAPAPSRPTLPPIVLQPVVKMETDIEARKRSQSLDESIEAVVKRQRFSVEEEKASENRKIEIVDTEPRSVPNIVTLMERTVPTKNDGSSLSESKTNMIAKDGTSLSVNEANTTAKETSDEKSSSTKTITADQIRVPAMDKTAVKSQDLEARRADPPVATLGTPKVEKGNTMDLSILPSSVVNTPISSPAQKSNGQRSLKKWLTPRSSLNEDTRSPSKTPKRPAKESENNLPYTCDRCGLRFVTITAAEQHMLSRHMKQGSVALCRYDHCIPCMAKISAEGIASISPLQKEEPAMAQENMIKEEDKAAPARKSIPLSTKKGKRFRRRRSNPTMEKDGFEMLDE